MPIDKLYPSNVSTVGSWFNPENIKANDNANAQTSGERNTVYEIVGSSFNKISLIPSTSIINSVTAEVEYKLSTTSSAWVGTLQAQKSGTISGTAETTTSESTAYNIWTNSNTGTWTYDDLSNAEVVFKVKRTSNTSCIYYVDYIALNVDYTVPTVDYNYSGSVSESLGDNNAIYSSKSSSESIVDYLGDVGLIIGVKPTYNKSVTLTDSIGYLSNLAGNKSIRSPTFQDSIGEVFYISSIRNIIQNITNSIGDVVSIIAAKIESYEYSTTITISLGNSNTLYSNKNANLNISDSIGDNSTLNTLRKSKITMSDSLGDVETVSCIKKISKSQSVSIGDSSALITSRKQNYSLTDSIGDKFTQKEYKGNTTSLTDFIGDISSIIAKKAYEFSTSLSDSVGDIGTIAHIRKYYNIVDLSFDWGTQWGRIWGICYTQDVYVSIYECVGDIANITADKVAEYSYRTSISDSIGDFENLSGNKSRKISFVSTNGENSILSTRKNCLNSILTFAGDLNTQSMHKEINTSITNYVGYVQTIYTSKQKSLSITNSIGDSYSSMYVVKKYVLVVDNLGDNYTFAYHKFDDSLFRFGRVSDSLGDLNLLIGATRRRSTIVSENGEIFVAVTQKENAAIITDNRGANLNLVINIGRKVGIFDNLGDEFFLIGNYDKTFSVAISISIGDIIVSNTVKNALGSASDSLGDRISIKIFNGKVDVTFIVSEQSIVAINLAEENGLTFNLTEDSIIGLNLTEENRGVVFDLVETDITLNLVKEIDYFIYDTVLEKYIVNQ